jgi:hypothetical protein
MVWEKSPPVISLYAISILLNHDPCLLIIRSEVIFSVCFCDRGRGRDRKRMGSMINRWEIEQEDTLTAKIQKLNQKVHYRVRGWRAACSSCAFAAAPGGPLHWIKLSYPSISLTLSSASWSRKILCRTLGGRILVRAL